MEIALFNREIISKFEEQLKTKKLDNMIYTMSKGKKNFASYKKETLEQLRLDLGLISHYTDKSFATNKGVQYIAYLELKDWEGNIVATGNGYSNTEESSSWSRGGGEADAMRLGALANKRALSGALTPILIRLGLDYETVAKKQGITLEGEWVHTSNVEDMKRLSEDKDTSKLPINKNLALALYKEAKEKVVVLKHLNGILQTYHGMGRVEQKDLTLAECSIITNAEFDLLKQIMKKEKEKVK